MAVNTYTLFHISFIYIFALWFLSIFLFFQYECFLNRSILLIEKAQTIRNRIDLRVKTIKEYSKLTRSLEQYNLHQIQFSVIYPGHQFLEVGSLFGFWDLWYINHCRLFNAKSIFIQINSSFSNNLVQHKFSVCQKNISISSYSV